MTPSHRCLSARAPRAALLVLSLLSCGFAGSAAFAATTQITADLGPPWIYQNVTDVSQTYANTGLAGNTSIAVSLETGALSFASQSTSTTYGVNVLGDLNETISITGFTGSEVISGSFVVNLTGSFSPNVGYESTHPNSPTARAHFDVHVSSNGAGYIVDRYQVYMYSSPYGSGNQIGTSFNLSDTLNFSVSAAAPNVNLYAVLDGLVLQGASADFSHTAQLQVSLPEGYGFTSSSGVFLAASPVPVPAAVWLFGSGLLGLIGIARRKQAGSSATTSDVMNK